jgi:hypothetical protein
MVLRSVMKFIELEFECPKGTEAVPESGDVVIFSSVGTQAIGYLHFPHPVSMSVSLRPQCGHYAVVNPPSATNAALCIKLLKGEARKVIESPISSIFAIRFNGVFAISLTRGASGSRGMLKSNGVST